MARIEAPRLVAGIAIALAIGVAAAPTAFAQEPASCEAWEVEYTLAANLVLSDTPLGQGDGSYAVGPGRVVLRFEDREGQPGGAATMSAYEMREYFTVKSKTFGFTTTVVTEDHTRATPDASGVAARGRLEGARLEWSTPVAGYRTDGTLTCDGSLCGKFGAPPPGRSELHIGPGPVQFQGFRFAKDLKTFMMPSTFVAKTDTPKQTAHIAVSGRESRRSCVPARASH